MQPYRTIFAVTAIDRSTIQPRKNTIRDMETPEYKTEIEVTVAVSQNKIPFTEINRAYRLAKEYQKYLKDLERLAMVGKFRKVGKPVRQDKALNFSPGYARVDFSPSKG